MRNEISKQLKVNNVKELYHLQDELYKIASKRANKTEEVQFKNLMKYAKNPVVIYQAMNNIKSNKGSDTPGPDGLTIRDYLKMIDTEFLELIKSKLDWYKAGPVKRVEIPKSNGKTRVLGIPNMIDRIIQEIFKIIMEPIAEAQMYEYSYGFRPYRSTTNAISYLKQVISTTQYEYIVEGDIKGYFDNIDHSIMIKSLKRLGIQDRTLLMIIKEMLKAGIIIITEESTLGTPQGGIISPLLSNIYLNGFDLWINNQWRNKKTKSEYSRYDVRINALRKTNLIPMYLVRYADDWIILTDNYKNACKIKEMCKEFFQDKLKLELSEEKTLITHINKKKFTFLGIDFYTKPNTKKNRFRFSVYTKPNEEKLSYQVNEIQKEIKKVAKHTKNKSELVSEINDINAKIRGLCNYYECATDVSIIMNKMEQRLIHAAGRLVYKAGGKLIPANETSNLPSIHLNYTQKINAINYNGSWIGITSIRFVNYKYELRNPKENRYTPEGRILKAARMKKVPIQIRAENINNLEIMELYSYRKGDIYNVEFITNRINTYIRDKGKCRCCSKEIIRDIRTHHINSKLSIDKVNKINNLITVCYKCHCKIHSNNEVNDTDLKTKKQIIKYRNKFNES